MRDLFFFCFAQTKSTYQQCYSNGFRYEVPTVLDREAYLDTLPRRWLKDFNKKDRVLSKNGEVSVCQSNLANLDESMDALQDMHRDRWQFRASFLVFESEHFDQFHRKILKRLIPKNKAYIKTLYLNDESLSCYYAFEDNNQIHYYQSAFYSKNTNRYMPLFYLICQQIRQAMAQGKRYDFMFDDNPDSYKKHQYASGSEPMYRLIWTASRYRLTVFNLYKKYKGVKQKMTELSVKNKTLLTGSKK